MRYFLDENIPKEAKPLIDERGFSFVDIRGTEHEGADDTLLFRLAQQHCAVFITTDRDFYHTIPLLVKEHCGIVVIALRQPNKQRILERLEWFMDHFAACDLHNKVFELRDRTYVVHPHTAVIDNHEL